MKKTALKVYPYLFLATILTVTLILIGQATQKPETAAKRVSEKKSGARVVKKSNHADRRKKSRRPSDKKVAQELPYEIIEADATDTTTSDLAAPAAASTATPVVPEPAVAPAPVTAPEAPPASPTPSKPEAPPAAPTPVSGAPKPEPTPAPTPVASLPQPKPTPAAPPAIASNTLLTAEQARSLQGLYPGISQGWTIELYEKVADEFYARYARWGGDKKPPPAAFQEFLSALGEEKSKRGLSFPRSWLVIWSNGNFIQATQTEQLDRTPLTDGLKKRSTRRSTSSRSAGLL